MAIRKRQQQRPFNGLWSGTTRVGRYQKEHSPTHTHPDHRASFIIFLHLQWSMASSLFNLRAWQSSRTTSFQVFFGLPLGLGPSTWCSIHFFTQLSSSFRNTWPYQRSLFCCNTNAMSSTPSLSPRWAGTRKVNQSGFYWRDSEWQWHQLGCVQVYTLIQTYNQTSTPPLSFYRTSALPATQPIASKHWRQTSELYSKRNLEVTK